MVLNPDIEKRKEIGKKIKNNQGYCCCMIVKNEDTKCPCKWQRECICGLYIDEQEMI